MAKATQDEQAHRGPFGSQEEVTRIILKSGDTTYVCGWANRHDACPNVKRQLQSAKSSPDRFLLMYRGDGDPLYLDNLFVMGQKARPLYHQGDLGQLKYTPRTLAEDVESFREIALAYVESPLGQSNHLTPDSLVKKYEALELQGRFWLSQGLIEGLQYQNCKSTVRRWRDLLFVISCSTSDEVALRYALGYRPSDEPPREAFVFEYAPPVDNGYYRRVPETIQQFRQLELGWLYPDGDSEVFAWYGMMPHYILGYATLTRDPRKQARYTVRYTPNPAYEERGATLEEPPEMMAEQLALMRETEKYVAWVWRRIDKEPEHIWLHAGDLRQDLGVPSE